MLVSVICISITFFHNIVVINNYLHGNQINGWTQVAAYWHKEIYKHTTYKHKAKNRTIDKKSQQ